MEEIINNISSPAWWVTAILAGVIASLTASYFKPLLDKLAGNLSQRYKAKVTAKKKHELNRIEKLRVEPNEQIVELLNVNHYRLRAVGFLLLGVISMTIFTSLPGLGVPYFLLMACGGFSLILIVSAFLDVLSAQKLRRVVMAARHDKNKF